MPEYAAKETSRFITSGSRGRNCPADHCAIRNSLRMILHLLYFVLPLPLSFNNSVNGGIQRNPNALPNLQPRQGEVQFVVRCESFYTASADQHL